MNKLQVLFLILLTTCCLAIVTPAYAAGVSLGVYPPIVQINATPPADIKSPLTIQNNSDESLEVKVELRPFAASDQEDGQIHYINQSEANFADPLIFQRVKVYDQDLEVSQLNIAPGQKKDLNLRIIVPKDSPQADYYFSILFLSSPKTAGQASSSQNVTGIASNVLLSVGQGEITGNVQEFSVPLLVENAPVPFTVRVKNTSNHFITPKGEIIISNIFGQKVGRISLLEANILSQSVRNIPSNEFVDEEKNLPGQLAAYWQNNFILGPYKATLNLALSNQGPAFSQTILFLAFPYKLVLGIVISAILLIYIISKIKTKV